MLGLGFGGYESACATCIVNAIFWIFAGDEKTM